MFGYPRAQILSMTLADISPAIQLDGMPSLDGALEMMSAAMRGEKPIREWTSRKASGEDFITEVRLVRLPSDEQNLVRISVIDITERKQVEAALRLTQFSVDNNADASYWMGEDARFFYVNDAATEMLGYTREEFLSMSVHDLDRGRPSTWPEHWQQLKEQGNFTFESKHITKDDRVVPVEISVNYVEFEGDEYNIAYARDISARKQAEEQIHAQNESLLKANQELAVARRQAEDSSRIKSEFLATMSHELRTPLNAVIGYTEIQLAGMTGELTEEQTDYQERVLKNGESLLKLIDDVLDLTKIEAGRVELMQEAVFSQSVT